MASSRRAKNRKKGQKVPLIINRGGKQVTVCASEAKPNRRGRSPRSERGAPLPKGKGDEED